ncbi:ArsR/SmtB family transcription factor [Mycoplasma nasistruthionis]|uniref:Helix-turn-helix transcriptional regulator n=1 Tax=Mycoplasma nasistruthionis TaxID=353852 RepID=A0A4Y6I5J9_9MOLU|nr:helix-turn-helix transcriptional regulator [Mycoplasma nasistruthionis]QDF64895.1 helix-turn-helix transcriptional regulator [Mycoplasma nasistruthionis]
MEITELLSVLSKDVKLKLIVHLYTCHEKECDVQLLAEIMQEKQANVSKHLSNLRQAHIVDVKKTKTHAFYFINKDFAKKYGNLLEEIIELGDFKQISCKCQDDGHINVHDHSHQHECIFNK